MCEALYCTHHICKYIIKLLSYSTNADNMWPYRFTHLSQTTKPTTYPILIFAIIALSSQEIIANSTRRQRVCRKTDAILFKFNQSQTGIICLNHLTHNGKHILCANHKANIEIFEISVKKQVTYRQHTTSPFSHRALRPAISARKCLRIGINHWLKCDFLYIYSNSVRWHRRLLLLNIMPFGFAICS